MSSAFAYITPGCGWLRVQCMAAGCDWHELILEFDAYGKLEGNQVREIRVNRSDAEMRELALAAARTHLARLHGIKGVALAGDAIVLAGTEGATA